ncbi:hypothetical protein DPMN_031545 [Dreissena polymorpha]|uniref:Uncharacterized protein n=1 Tax=Dreissena polymorpha TaxID=45954 RepID=A0A9D4M2D3_DREPO|nr:hypothetical protein DPMN_031545 [Dreissena polymorpha]
MRVLGCVTKAGFPANLAIRENLEKDSLFPFWTDRRTDRWTDGQTAGLLNNILIEAAKKDFYNEHRQSQVVRDSMERDIVGLERDTLQVRMDKSGSGKVENVKTGSTDGTDVDKL